MNINRNLIATFAALAMAVNAGAQRPAAVYITAGQSNADGRASVENLPEYLKNGYKHLRYANVTGSADGHFADHKWGKRFAFCDITNHLIDQNATQDFYAVKCTYGGTAIDTVPNAGKRPCWCADSAWLSRNKAYRGDPQTQRSLAKALAEGFAVCADSTLSKLPQGYDVKAIMWHQGESDRHSSASYYDNFKQLITYLRNAVYAKTRREKDLTLPFIFGTVPHKSRQYSREVEAAQRQVAAELPNVYCIDMSNATLLPDVLHFDSAATENLGRLMYDKLCELRLVDK